LIAVGLGATVAVLSKKTGSSLEQQVVVVGGGRDELPSAELEAARSIEATNGSAATPTNENHEVAVQNASRSGVEPPLVHAKAAASPSSSSGGHSQLADAVQQKSGSFQACFVHHLEAGQAAPQAVLHFDVVKTGGAAQVKAEPPAVANTPLGRCLVQAGSSVRFPALEQPVSFRVPVRARVSRTSGK
jgi:hypothetical protein